MEMKPVHMMTSSPTKMLGILSAFAQSVKIIVPICDFITSTKIKKEKLDKFMFSKGVIDTYLLADFEVLKPF